MFLLPLSCFRAPFAFYLGLASERVVRREAITLTLRVVRVQGVILRSIGVITQDRRRRLRVRLFTRQGRVTYLILILYTGDFVCYGRTRQEVWSALNWSRLMDSDQSRGHMYWLYFLTAERLPRHLVNIALLPVILMGLLQLVYMPSARVRRQLSP